MEFQAFLTARHHNIHTASLQTLRQALLDMITGMWLGRRRKYSTIRLAVTGVVSITKDMTGLDLMDTRIHRMLEGVRRTLGDAIQRADPILAQHIAALTLLPPPTIGMAPWSGSNQTLQWIHLVAAAGLAFLGALRFQELAQLRVCDIRWYTKHAIVTIRHSKTDQGGSSAQVVLAKATQGFCMLSYIQRAVQLITGSLHPCSTCAKRNSPNACCRKCPFLFPTVRAHSIHARTAISNQTFNARLKAAFKRLANAGMVSDNFNTSAHGLRRGCVTQVCSKANRPRLLLLEVHGRWNQKARSRDTIHSAMAGYEDVVPEDLMLIPNTLADAIAIAVATLLSGAI